MHKMSGRIFFLTSSHVLGSNQLGSLFPSTSSGRSSVLPASITMYRPPKIPRDIAFQIMRTAELCLLMCSAFMSFWGQLKRVWVAPSSSGFMLLQSGQKEFVAVWP
jgi:hypothetical protein